MEKGLIHLYCGEGKGKTTASIGLIVRASGAGYRAVIAQYFKSWDTGELRILEKFPNVTVIHGDLPEGFTWELSTDASRDMTLIHNEMFRKAVSAAADPAQKTLLVLDEIIGATSYSYIDTEMVLDYLRNKPDHVEVVLTGRNPLQEFVELADYVSNITKVKHPYDQGILARPGIEY